MYFAPHHPVAGILTSMHTSSSVPVIKSKLPQVGTTIFTVMSRLAVQHNAVNLGQGFPDFAPSPELVNLVTKAMQSGHNQYAPMEGVVALREQIAVKTQKLYGFAPDPVEDYRYLRRHQRRCTRSSTVIRPGDEAIVLEPCYDSYIPAIELNGGVAVRVPLTPGTYGLNWDLLKRSINSRTRLLMINTPHNPTGTILTAKDMRQLADLLRDTDIFLISDEVYEHIIFDEPHWSALREPALQKGLSWCRRSAKPTPPAGNWAAWLRPP